VSLDTGAFYLGLHTDPGLTPFLEIREVAFALQSEANILVGPIGGTELAYSTTCEQELAPCHPNELLAPGTGAQDVIADQCCEHWYLENGKSPAPSCTTPEQMFKRSTDNLIVKRFANPTGATCVGDATTGNFEGPCDPVNGCWYGPNGWGHAQILSGTAADNVSIYVPGNGGTDECEEGGTAAYGNATGTVPRGANCLPEGNVAENEAVAFEY
jgi:hypothetical protein